MEKRGGRKEGGERECSIAMPYSRSDRVCATAYTVDFQLSPTSRKAALDRNSARIVSIPEWRI